MLQDSAFWAICAARAVIKIHSILLKYPILDFFFHGQGKYKIRVTVHFSIHNKKLININVMTMLFFALKYNFWFKIV